MTLRRSTRSTALAAALVLVAFAGVAGCSSDGSDGSSTTTARTDETTTPVDGTATTAGDDTTTTTAAGTPAETTTTAPPATTTAPSGGAEPTGDASVIDAFTELRTEHCTGPTPEPIGTEETADGQLVMVDNEGNRLVVDGDTVHGLDGPDGDLPAAYATGCDPDVFVGTSD